MLFSLQFSTGRDIQKHDQILAPSGTFGWVSLRWASANNDTLTPVSTSHLNWVDSNTSKSRRGTTLPGVVGICHTSGSDASRDTSGFTAVFAPRRANGVRTLRSLTVGMARDSPRTLWNLLDPLLDAARVGCDVARESSPPRTEGYRLKGARPGLYWVRRAGPSSFSPNQE